MASSEGYIRRKPTKNEFVKDQLIHSGKVIRRGRSSSIVEKDNMIIKTISNADFDLATFKLQLNWESKKKNCTKCQENFEIKDNT